jgi:hypothetical protein
MAKPERVKHPAAVMLGHLGGRVRSKAQQAASRRNIKRATAARLAQRAKKRS